MAAQPPQLHTLLQIGGMAVTAQSHRIVYASESARSAALLLSQALAQLHPHAERFEPQGADAFLAENKQQQIATPIIVGRHVELLQSLGLREHAEACLAPVSSTVPLASSAAASAPPSIDWSVSAHAVAANGGGSSSNLALLFLGSSKTEGAASAEEVETRNLQAAVLWLAKEVIACDLSKLVQQASSFAAAGSAGAASASAAAAPAASPSGRVSPPTNAQLSIARLHVRWSFPSADLRSSLGLRGEATARIQELAAYTDQLDLLLDGENSELGLDLSHAPIAHVASPPAAASAVSPSLSPSPDTPVADALPSVLDPLYVAPPPHKHAALQALHGGALPSALGAESVSDALRVSKPLIAVDLDEVLGDFVPQLVHFWNATYGASAKSGPGPRRDYTVNDFHSYAFQEVWGGSSAESAEVVEAFFVSPWFADIPVVPGAFAALSALKSKFDFTVVTSRQHHLEPLTRRWLAKHYPDIFSGVYFGNHWATSGVKQSKPDMCVAINAVAIIDDSVTYAFQCASVLQRVFLFGEYAWNNKLPPGQNGLPKNVQRFKNWEQLRAELEQWTPVAQQAEAE